LAVTFTNKAASEMKTRIANLTGADFTLSPYDSPKTHPFIGTFHALSLHIIRTFHAEAGLQARFTIYDRSDSTRAAKKAIEDAGFDPKELEPRRVISAMSKAKGEALSSTEFRDRSRSYIDEAIAEVWERYDVILAKEKALDFDDILLVAHKLLSTKESVREHFQNAWEYLHVDEYQDTNGVQYDIVRTLAAKHGNIAVVGDADQNIYSWRGASLEHIMNFEHDFPDATVVVLTENYRSTKTILSAANDAIAKNKRRKEKVLTTKNDEGEPITLANLPDEVGEARFIARECARLCQGSGGQAPIAPEDIAVLYRANFQSRVLEEEFLRAGVAYQVLGTRFFERKEIKDALSYLKLATVGESAAELARALATPARGLGKVALAKVLSGQEGDLPEGQRQKVSSFRAVLQRIEVRIESARASEVVRYALNESGLWQLYEQGKGEDEERLENLKELVSVASKYDGLPASEGIARLLDEAALQSDQDELTQKKEDKPGVKLMTIHAAKGLEFPVVFITGLEAGLFPHEHDDEGSDDEEERRLFYVALTRAEKKAYLTYADTRRIFGTRSINVPSEFVTEMNPSLMDAIDPREAYDDTDATIS
jgi:DNA helicase-2/ATP-dependent DNA helicase PcrA